MAISVEYLWLRATTAEGLQEAYRVLGLMETDPEPHVKQGVSIMEWPPGSLADGRPAPDGSGSVMNSEHWANVLIGPPLDGVWTESARDAFRDGATGEPKMSLNGNGPSQWSKRTDVWMFETNADGGPQPLKARQEWAV